MVNTLFKLKKGCLFLSEIAIVPTILLMDTTINSSFCRIRCLKTQKYFLFLDTQYQRKHVQMLRSKMMSGGGPDGQLNRLRNMNGAGGMMMTEYNPNYEFGGGTCTIQDLKEIPREHLRLVKYVFILFLPL